jgi:hypothetical protein
MTSSRRSFLAGLPLFVWSSVARAQGPVAGLLGRIANARSQVHTLQGPFTQIRTIGLLLTDVRSRGSLAFVRPDRLRWQLEPPDDVTFWVGPDGLAYRSLHSRGRLPTTKGGAAATLQDLLIVLSGDLAELGERWSLVVVRDDSSGAELELTARAPSPTGVRSMRFALATDLTRPTRALLVHGPHDRTSIEFGELLVNAPIDDHIMSPG